MIRAFAARIAFLNAVLAVVLFAIIGSIAAFVTYAALQSSMSQNIDRTVREVPVVVAYYRSTALAVAAPKIVAALSSPGVRVVIHDDVTHRLYDGTHAAGMQMRGPGGPGPGGPPGGPGPNDFRGGPGGGSAGDLGYGSGEGGPGFGPGPPFGAGLGNGRRPISRSGLAAIAFLRIDPVRVPIGGGSVDVLADPSTLGSVWQMFAFAMALAGLLAALAAWAIGGVVSRASVRPLHEVTSELERFGDGDFSPRNVSALERGEYAGLARAYNRAAAQVARALDERSEAEREMRQFIADAAHELRTPLTIVTGYVELLRGGVDDSRAEKIFATIGIESDRMRECIAKLIALARLDSTREMKHERVDLSALAQRVAETFASVPDGERLSIVTERAVVVEGDPAELQEAVMNLLDNAIKYGAGAPVRVTVDADADGARLVVADDGPGMSEFEAANAFARFFRGDARGEREGSGLGLAIVARIVERAGGTIALATAPGSGAAFTIRLKRM